MTRYRDCSLTVFEPNPFSFELLEKNLLEFIKTRDTKCKACVNLINKAAWYEETTVEFQIDKNNPSNIASNMTQRMKDHQWDIETIHVDTVNIKNFLSDKVDLMKIDVEGAEYSLLKIEEINADNVKNIVIEIHDMDNHREELYEIGTQLFNIRGYRATDAAGLDVSLEKFIRGSGTNVFKFFRATH